jgi:transposase
MMGIKDRSFAVLPHNISLEELVPKENFYRRLQSTLDLSFVRDLVRPLYAGAGRPSVDPVVFCKLQLVMFFEDLRSERKLMSVVADRLSLRWYLGYDLGEPLPDHSSLTRIRERYGLSVFRRFFERIVEMCVEAGLVWGRNCTSMLPRSRPTLRLTRRGRARSLRTCTSAERSTWRRSSLNRDLSSKMHTLQGSPLWWDPRLRKDERWHRKTRASTAGFKDWHGLRRFRLRRLEKVNAEALLIASGQNIKRLLAFGYRGPRRPAQVAALRQPVTNPYKFRGVLRHRKRYSRRSARVFQQPDVFSELREGGCLVTAVSWYTDSN